MINLKTFGKHPTGDRLKRISHSPNYKNGTFQNIHPTPMTERASTIELTIRFILTTFQKNLLPPKALPYVKNDLMNADFSVPKITWFGHSSYLIQHKGKNILVDPVLDGYASPASFLVKAFPGTNIYTVKDLPEIDLLILTHDHYDHLDHVTVKALAARTKKIIAPLGLGAHLENWGYTTETFTEMDWWDIFNLNSEIKVTATPARHFSGRTFLLQKTLWASYMLELDHFKIFIGGDSGYDDQFKKIGQHFGTVDLAILECGQYGDHWPYIHMFPEQTAQAAIDLNAKYLFPVHWGKFALARHAWNESIERLFKKASELQIKIATPIIGEPIILGETPPSKIWWR